MIDSLKKTLHDRITSPFTGSFLVSWAIINWKVILVLFSSEEYNQKIILIQELFTPFWWDGALHFVVFPFLGAVFYITFYQLIVAGSIWLLHLFGKPKKMADGSEVLTKKESKKLIAKNMELQKTNERLESDKEHLRSDNKLKSDGLVNMSEN